MAKKRILDIDFYFCSRPYELRIRPEIYHAFRPDRFVSVEWMWFVVEVHIR